MVAIVARRAGAVLVALLVVLATLVALPTPRSLLPSAAADGKHDYSYSNCYYAHGYWHCRNGGDSYGGDWWWHSGNEKCHQHDKWYCYGSRGHGKDEHGHGGG